MDFKTIYRIIHDIIVDTPTLTLDDAVIACFRARLPQDSGVFQDLRCITTILTIDDYTDLIQLGIYALSESFTVSRDVVIRSYVIPIADFYGTRAFKLKTKTVAEKKNDFIRAAEVFLSLYAQLKPEQSDNIAVALRKFAPVYYNLHLLAEELLSFEEVYAPTKT